MTHYTYDADGNVLTSTDADGNVTHYAYNLDGEVTLMTDPDGNRTVYTYDLDGRVLSETTKDGKRPVEHVLALMSTVGSRKDRAKTAGELLRSAGRLG